MIVLHVTQKIANVMGHIGVIDGVGNFSKGRTTYIAHLSNHSIDFVLILQIPPVRINNLQIMSSTTARFTNTSISTNLINRANISQDIEISLRLPDEAFITELFM